jgi:hypothetical protein
LDSANLELAGNNAPVRADEAAFVEMHGGGRNLTANDVTPAKTVALEWQSSGVPIVLAAPWVMSELNPEVEAAKAAQTVILQALQAYARHVKVENHT